MKNTIVQKHDLYRCTTVLQQVAEIRVKRSHFHRRNTTRENIAVSRGTEACETIQLHTSVKIMYTFNS